MHLRPAAEGDEPLPIRQRIIEALRLAASAEQQRRYEAAVPIADVTAEVFCIWGDNYFPDSPWLRRVFTPREQDVLARYAVVNDAIAPSLPDRLTLAEFQARPESRELADAAMRALAALDAPDR